MRLRLFNDPCRHSGFSRVASALLFLTAIGVSGCGMGRTAMQIDSDSRSPFLTWQVPISANKGDARIKTASAIPAAATIEPLKLEQQPPRATANAWAGWFQKLRPPITIPLPRTDIDDDGEIIDGPRPAAPTIDDF